MLNRIESCLEVNDVKVDEHDGIIVSTNLEFEDINGILLSTISTEIMENTNSPYGLLVGENFEFEQVAEANDLHLVYDHKPNNIEPYILFYGKVLDIGMEDLTQITGSVDDGQKSLEELNEILWSNVGVSMEYTKKGFVDRMNIPEKLLKNA